jgi:hypothetical protein
LKLFQESRKGGCGRAVVGANSNLIHCENLCKCYNVPPPSTTIKNKFIFKKLRVDCFPSFVEARPSFVHVRLDFYNQSQED